MMYNVSLIKLQMSYKQITSDMLPLKLDISVFK